MDNPCLLLFLKFSDRQYSERLLNEGEIFMKPLKDHQEHGDNFERQDHFEGAIDNSYRENFIMQMKFDPSEDWKDLKILHANTNHLADLSGKVCYSLVALTLEDIRQAGIFRLSPDLKKFGDSFILIRNTVEFLNRIDTWLNDNGLKFQRHFVRYWDRKEDQNRLTLLHKKSDHRHHFEFRYVVDYIPDAGPLVFQIGNISEFAQIVDSSVIDTMRIKLPEGQ